MAITKEENIISNLSYTEKDFQVIYPALLDLVKKETLKWDPSASNESDPGVLLLKLNALIADKCNYNIDKNVLECFPVSVTQVQNARQIFEQLGYYMHWYRGATTLVTMKYIVDEDTDTSSSYDVPRFTMVSDDQNSTIYTIVDKKSLKTDGTAQIFNAIQGICVKYSINDKTDITTSDLDSNNRLYFEDTNIAENGIFIRHKDSEDYSRWERKDNLLVEEISSNNYYYKFGVSQDMGTCYLEFPDNSEELFQDGINIIYIKTSGADGNIAALALENFYNDTSSSDTDTESSSSEEVLTLTTENVSISNYINGTGGEDPETINDAYLNYKKTVGTFETLITLRDYMNAVAQSDFVSNAVVSDRTNDIQSSYDIISENGSVQQLMNEVALTEKYDKEGYLSSDKTEFYSDSELTLKIDPDEDLNYYDLTSGKSYRLIYKDGDPLYIEADPVERAAMNAFDLKMYLLSATSLLKNATHYNSTFELDLNDETQGYVDAEINNYKCVQHNFIDLLPGKLCFIKAKYPVDCKIIPQYALTSSQQTDVAKNIREALYSNLNSAEVEFGSEIVYEDLYNIIMNADSRIKAVALEPLTYTAYAVYIDEDEYGTKEVKEINISECSTYYRNTYTLNTALSDLSSSTTSYDIKLAVLDSEGSTIGTASGISIEGSGSNLTVTLQEYTTIDEEFTTDKIIYQNASWTGSWNIIKILENTDLLDTDIITWFTTNSDTITVDTEKTLSDDIINQFRTEIYAKSVLAGKTRFFIKDSKFDYGINQKYQLLEDDIGRLKTNLNVTFSEDTTWEYTVRENEIIQLCAPNLIEYANYSSNIRFEYCLGPESEEVQVAKTIRANTSYQLGTNEWIIFYWASDSEINTGYNYAVYGAGAIIRPSFNLNAGVISTDQLKGNILLTNAKDITLNNQTYKYASGDTIENDDLTAAIMELDDSANILSDNRSIDILLKNTLSITSDDYYCYWVLNESDNDKYVLFDNTETSAKTRVLNSGEYFIYTGPTQTDMHIMGPGTQITNTIAGVPTYQLACTAMDYSTIESEGLTALDGYWVQLGSSYALDILENQYMAFSEGTVLHIENSESADINLNSTETVSLASCTIKYKDNVTTSDWTNISKIILNSTDFSWKARTLLRLNASVSNPQVLRAGQSITYYKYDSDEKRKWIIDDSKRDYYTDDEWELVKPGIIDPSEDPFSDPSYILVSRLINALGPAISTIEYDLNNKAIPLSIYAYVLGDKEDDVLFLDGGSTQILFKGSSDAKSLEKIQSRYVEFKLPGGSYIMPLNHSTDSNVIKRLNVFLSSSKNPTEQLLASMGDTATTNLYKSGHYYLNIADLEDSKSDKNFYVKVRVEIEYIKQASTASEVPIVAIIIPPIFRYDNSDALSTDTKLNEDLFIKVYEKIQELDYHHIFDYTYELDEDEEIEDPLNPKSYLDSHHILNAFTICQMDTSDNSNIYITNTIKG